MRRDRAAWRAVLAAAVLAAVTVAAPLVGLSPIVSVVSAALAVLIALWSTTRKRGAPPKR